MVQHKGKTIVEEIKENGYVRWKALLMGVGGLLITILLYVDTRMVSKAQFDEAQKHIMIHLQDIKKQLNKK